MRKSLGVLNVYSFFKIFEPSILNLIISISYNFNLTYPLFSCMKKMEVGLRNYRLFMKMMPCMDILLLSSSLVVGLKVALPFQGPLGSLLNCSRNGP